MANVSLKTDFRNGEKLFDFQLNNNFKAIVAALEAMNRIAWQDLPEESFIGFRGTTEQIQEREIVNGQLLYDTTTGETFIDYNDQRISTGSGNAIHIGEDEPENPSTQIWINPEEPLQVIGSEVVDSMEGEETNKAPSVNAVKDYYSPQSVDYNDYLTFSSGITVSTCSAFKIGSIVFINFDINATINQYVTVIGSVNVELKQSSFGGARVSMANYNIVPATIMALSNGQLRVYSQSAGVATAGQIILVLDEEVE